MPSEGHHDRAAERARADELVTVLVVDDQASFRAALRELVERTDGFSLVGEAGTGEAALEAADRLSPRMVIMDKRMPGMDGFEATRMLTARHPEIVTLLVSVEAPDEARARACGAAAFARKQELTTTLVREVWREHGRDA